MEARMNKELVAYKTEDQREPFTEWLYSIKDKVNQKRILVRLKRIAQGNYGDHKRFSGIVELRFDFGKGYRVYCGEDGHTLVLLLIGGDKGSQEKDIQKALQYWEVYNEQK
jgi:putative addiction module killer protein